MVKKCEIRTGSIGNINFFVLQAHGDRESCGPCIDGENLEFDEVVMSSVAKESNIVNQQLLKGYYIFSDPQSTFNKCTCVKVFLE